MTITLTPAPDLKRQYPHVDGVTDWRAAQSLRLLWDRVFDLEARLQALSLTQGELVSAVNTQEDELENVRLAAGEALATAQSTAAEQEEEETGGGGPSTIPDFGSYIDAALAMFVSNIVPVGSDTAAKAQLIRLAAWNIYQDDPNIRLLKVSPPHSNVNGRSADVLVYATDGSKADCASEDSHDEDATIPVGFMRVNAQWSDGGPDRNTSDSSRWITPTAAIAAESGPMTLI